MDPSEKAEPTEEPKNQQGQQDSAQKEEEEIPTKEPTDEAPADNDEPEDGKETVPVIRRANPAPQEAKNEEKKGNNEGGNSPEKTNENGSKSPIKDRIKKNSDSETTPELNIVRELKDIEGLKKVSLRTYLVTPKAKKSKLGFPHMIPGLRNQLFIGSKNSDFYQVTTSRKDKKDEYNKYKPVLSINEVRFSSILLERANTGGAVVMVKATNYPNTLTNRAGVSVISVNPGHHAQGDSEGKEESGKSGGYSDALSIRFQYLKDQKMVNVIHNFEKKVHIDLLNLSSLRVVKREVVGFESATKINYIFEFDGASGRCMVDTRGSIYIEGKEVFKPKPKGE